MVLPFFLQIKSTYRHQLSERESQYGEMHAEMLKELHRLREELGKLGKTVPDIAYDFELMGDCPTLASPPVSPATNGNGTPSSAAKTGKHSVAAVKIKPEPGVDDVTTTTTTSTSVPSSNKNTAVSTTSGAGNKRKAPPPTATTTTQAEFLVKSEVKEEKKE